jgi:hypothetical protein
MQATSSGISRRAERRLGARLLRAIRTVGNRDRSRAYSGEIVFYASPAFGVNFRFREELRQGPGVLDTESLGLPGVGASAACGRESAITGTLGAAAPRIRGRD